MITRPANESDIPALAKVHVSAWRTAYRGILADSFLESLSIEKHEQRHRRFMGRPGTIYWLAEEPAGEIVGFLLGGRERSGDAKFLGEIYAIYFLDAHRRRGFGAQLVRRWAGTLRQDHVNTALVWVLADNKAGIAFYERMGARRLREQPLEIGGASFVEVAYGWDDLRSLDVDD